MNNKFRVILAFLQIITGLLGFIVFVQSIFTGGKLTTMIFSFLLMILGLLNGIRGLSWRNKD